MFSGCALNGLPIPAFAALVALKTAAFVLDQGGPAVLAPGAEVELVGQRRAECIEILATVAPIPVRLDVVAAGKRVCLRRGRPRGQELVGIAGQRVRRALARIVADEVVGLVIEPQREERARGQFLLDPDHPVRKPRVALGAGARGIDRVIDHARVDDHRVLLRGGDRRSQHAAQVGEIVVVVLRFPDGKRPSLFIVCGDEPGAREHPVERLPNREFAVHGIGADALHGGDADDHAAARLLGENLQRFLGGIGWDIKHAFARLVRARRGHPE